MVAMASPSKHPPRSAPSPIAVRFQRGGCLVCANAAQARVLIARHLERARRNGVDDRVVSAPDGLAANLS